jgi:hypothetical protein
MRDSKRNPYNPNSKRQTEPPRSSYYSFYEQLKALPADESFEFFKGSVGTWFPGDSDDELACATYLLKRLNDALIAKGALDHPSYQYMHVSSKWLQINYDLKQLSQPVANEQDKMLAKHLPHAPNSSSSGTEEGVSADDNILRWALPTTSAPAVTEAASEGQTASSGSSALEGLSLSSLVQLEEAISTRIIGQSGAIRMVVEHLQMT